MSQKIIEVPGDEHFHTDTGYQNLGYSAIARELQYILSYYQGVICGG